MSGVGSESARVALSSRLNRASFPSCFVAAGQPGWAAPLVHPLLQRCTKGFEHRPLPLIQATWAFP